MKNQFVVTIGVCVLFMFSSCSKNKNKSTETAEADKEEVSGKECKIATYTYELGESGKKMTFTYEDDKATSVQIEKADGESTTIMTYAYDDSGRLATFTMDQTVGTYEYDQEGRLIQISGEGNLLTRAMEYDESGRIIKQNTLFNDKIASTHAYEYDENDAPVKVTVNSSFGGAITEYLLAYDDSQNPLAGHALFVNSNEFLLGYPVGNYDKNIKSIQTTYVDTGEGKTKVNGKEVKSGDVTSNEIDYEYNEDGYVSSYANDETSNRIELTYNCI